jgi:hypothetical protein
MRLRSAPYLAGTLAGIGLSGGCHPRSEPAALKTGAEQSVSSVRSVAALKGMLDRLPFQHVFVLGYHDPGDGGGGAFYWDAASLATDDGGLVFSPVNWNGSKPGRWRRMPEASGAIQVQWFGARCDSSTPDDSAFQLALLAANSSSATILIPAGKMCVVSQINFGQATRNAQTLVGQSAVGVTLRGSGSAWPAATNPSAIFINPAMPVTGECKDLENNTSSVINNGGIAVGPNVSVVAFENLALMAGPNLGNCIVNVSHSADSQPGGDPFRIRFSEVAFLGNGATTSVGVYLSNTGYITFDDCLFYRSKTGIRGNLRAYSYNTRIVHCMFYPLNQAELCTTPAVWFGDAEALDLSDNVFEYGLSGVSLQGLRGGTVRSNWFNAEGVDPRTARAEWMRVECEGCAIEGNRIIGGGVEGIVVRARGAIVAGNNIQGGLRGTPLSVDGIGISVLNNFFEAGTSALQSDIRIAGVDQIVAGNVHFGSNGHSVTFMSGSRGLFGYEESADRTSGKVEDLSSPSAGGPSGWTRMFMTSRNLVPTADSAPRDARSEHAAPGRAR